MGRLRAHLNYYISGLPIMIKVVLASWIAKLLCVRIVRTVATWLMHSTGRLAITTANFKFLFVTWQGWALLALILAFLTLFVIIDVNTKIVATGYAARQKQVTVKQVWKETFRRSRPLFSLQGIFVILALVILVPLVGFGINTSLTSNFQIPYFIMEVIDSTPRYYVLYIVGICGLLYLFFRHFFTLHFILLDGKDVKEAHRLSSLVMHTHARRFIPYYLVYCGGLSIGLGLLPWMGRVFLENVCSFSLETEGQIYLATVAGLLAVGLMFASKKMYMALQMMEMTRFYYMYTEQDLITPQTKRGWKWIAVIGITALLVVSAGGFIPVVFPELVFYESETQVVAHRAGGDLAAENTLEGLHKALEEGAYGGEIDVQRTKDGVYVINHDNTFQRLCGVKKTAQDMTYDEIRALSVKNTFQEDGASQPVATLEEMLDAIEGDHLLFVELKGKTADRQMADDVAAMVREKGKQDNVVIISLKYNLISYLHENYQDLQTGLLYFAAYGDDAQLECDYLLMEERVATRDKLWQIHLSGKKAVVWTVDEESSIKHFLQGEADAIITNEVEEAMAVKQQLDSESMPEQLRDYFLDVLTER